VKKRVAVLISGRGSNLKALIDACADPAFPAAIALVVSNKADAPGLAVARDAGVPLAVISHADYADRAAFDTTIDAELEKARIEIVCDAGFMRIHSDGFVKKWEGRIAQHPSLAASRLKGIRVHQQALDAGVKVSGCTVHFIVAELDSGPIIAQAAVPVLAGDTVETLSERVLVEEHRIYPQALKLLADGKVRLEGGRARFL
jgi:phosphoribosylglycinamide formyltransferase-1